MIIIDFDYLIQNITPPVHRTVEVIGSIKANFAPLATLRDWFYAFHDKIEYDLTWNGQVCMLEHLLNLEFDDINQGIYITDAENVDKLFLFNNAEQNESTFLYNMTEGEDPIYIYNKSEVSQYHFVVNIPSTVAFNEDQLKFFVNKYRVAGKRWKIEIV